MGRRPPKEDSKFDPLLTTGSESRFPVDSSGCWRHLTQGVFAILVRVSEMGDSLHTLRSLRHHRRHCPKSALSRFLKGRECRAAESCDYATDFKGARVHSWLPNAAINSHSGL
jgi:hypothetical protein